MEYGSLFFNKEKKTKPIVFFLNPDLKFFFIFNAENTAAEHPVLTNTISRSYFNFKNCYAGGFILSHFTFQHNLHSINQTINFRVPVLPLPSWTFKQNNQENKSNTCDGHIILVVWRGAFGGKACPYVLKTVKALGH